ncbi:MAG: hypothetical protein AAGG07_00280 [Planctomycetota bacterium]
MGVMTRLGRVFTGRSTPRAEARQQGSASVAERLGGVAPSSPVRVEAPVSDEALDQGPRNRQELLNELQQNYREVVGLVRKVDQHLDEQRDRSEKLLEIASTVPTSLAVLPEIRDQTVRLSTAIEQLNELSAIHADRAESAGRAQHAALEQVRTLLEQSGHAEARVAQSVEAFSETVSGMSRATEGLGTLIDHMAQRDAEREAKLVAALDKGQRTMGTVAGLCGVAVLTAIAVALVVLAVA